MRAKRQQLTLDLPEDLRYEVRMAALKRHMTLRAWIIAVFGDALRREKSVNGVEEKQLNPGGLKMEEKKYFACEHDQQIICHEYSTCKHEDEIICFECDSYHAHDGCLLCQICPENKTCYECDGCKACEP